MKVTAVIQVRDHNAEMLRGGHVGQEQHLLHVDVSDVIRRIAAKKFPNKWIGIDAVGHHDGARCDNGHLDK